MDLLSASCRVAFVGLCHDLGKFAQRAQIASLKSDKDTHVQLYCPRTADGYPTHIHAAFTALGFDAVERIAPPLSEGDVYPFENRDGLSENTDSLINCCAAHHRPQTFLQWIVATADRVASGFERESFDRYNTAPENEDFYTSRLLTLFEQIRFSYSQALPRQFQFVYPLKPLSVAATYPNQIASLDRNTAVAQYKALWREFISAVETGSGENQAIGVHRVNWPLWLDHFESLWLTFTHCIPSATAFGAKPDVSLYDHSKATAALATALWRWHQSCGLTGENAVNAMKTRADWGQKKILLIQGDCFGIQDFIFAEGSVTNKKAAKILRGRSFYVSLLSELAALRVLEALELPGTSQIINAAGKFLIVAPNTEQTIQALERVQKEINDWFVDNTFAVSGLGICWEPAACDDFVAGRFSQLQKRLFESMEVLKHRRYGLCLKETPVVLQADYSHGVCAWNGRYPADQDQGGTPSCALSRDQIRIGDWLTESTHVLIVAADRNIDSGWNVCEKPIFGYKVVFSDRRAELTRQLACSGALRRMWDISLPQSEEEVLWNGCARRNISGYVARFDQRDLDKTEIYDEQARDDGEGVGQIKSFSHLACEDRLLEKDGSVVGVSALAVLKGDVDNLGRIFGEGLSSDFFGENGARRMTFAKMATLSRQINNFFSVCVPYICGSRYRNIYTVFAGGDDFFFVGPWKTTQAFLSTLSIQFESFTTGNPCVHFSAGVSVCKASTPVNQMARFAEDALEASKERPGKNAVTLYGCTVDWKSWFQLQECVRHLEIVKDQYDLSSGYLYGLFELINMSEREATDPTASLWRSRFRYRTARHAEEVSRKGKGEKAVIINGLTDEIYRYIERYRCNYRIALTNFFYLRRQ